MEIEHFNTGERTVNSIILYPGAYNAFTTRFNFKQVLVLVEQFIMCKSSFKEINNTSNTLTIGRCKNTKYQPFLGERNGTNKMYSKKQLCITELERNLAKQQPTSGTTEMHQYYYLGGYTMHWCTAGAQYLLCLVLTHKKQSSNY